MPRPAARPAYSVLRSERADAIRLPHWRDGVAAYLAEREPAVGGTRR
jgi:dTDP-4-dehydrorhamnose reductase